eukprot:GHVU01205775.1.p1 GENE.GHVU01205775.1~~GHVU01205775.1.p1  ORF type:complete len:358 (+),score=27.25 GHVU01205775.1:203-1276(+)
MRSAAAASSSAAGISGAGHGGANSSGLQTTPEEILLLQSDESGQIPAKHLVVRNVTSQVLKVSIDPPPERCGFELESTMAGPSALCFTLAAGMKRTVVVRFASLDRSLFVDGATHQLAVASQLGTHIVTLIASRARKALELVDRVEFPLCAVDEVARVPLDLNNKGPQPVQVTWETPPPFSIVPLRQVIPPRSTFTFTATFSPPLASAFEAGAVCHSDGDVGSLPFTNTVTLFGVGKLCFLTFSSGPAASDNAENDRGPGTAMVTGTAGDAVKINRRREVEDPQLRILQFPPTPIGVSRQMQICIENKSEVRTKFEVRTCGGAVGRGFTHPPSLANFLVRAVARYFAYSLTDPRSRF